MEGSRYDESVVGSSLLPIACPPEAMSQWRIKKKVVFPNYVDFID